MSLQKSSLKRAFIYGIIGSLILSALMGIFVIIQGNFDDIDWKILLTTLLIGVFSITSLASLRTLESDSPVLRAFSEINILVSLVAAILAIFMIWNGWYDDTETLLKIQTSLTVLAISSAHAILLLPLMQRSQTVRSIVRFTVAFIAVVGGIIIYLIVRPWDSDSPSEVLFRALAVFAILDVLGTILAPIMAKFMSPKTLSPQD